MNKDFLKLNKNILLSGVVAAILANIAAYIFSDQEAHLLTTYTVIAEYIGFFGVIRMEKIGSNATKTKNVLIKLAFLANYHKCSRDFSVSKIVNGNIFFL